MTFMTMYASTTITQNGISATSRVLFCPMIDTEVQDRTKLMPAKMAITDGTVSVHFESFFLKK